MKIPKVNLKMSLIFPLSSHPGLKAKYTETSLVARNETHRNSKEMLLSTYINKYIMHHYIFFEN